MENVHSFKYFDFSMLFIIANVELENALREKNLGFKPKFFDVLWLLSVGSNINKDYELSAPLEIKISK